MKPRARQGKGNPTNERILDVPTEAWLGIHLSTVRQSGRRPRRSFAQPVTQYAKSGAIRIAYQVFGRGPPNVVLAPPFVSSIENYWDEPDTARWLLRLEATRGW